jgi:uncharacterized protein (DUF2164 family)
VSGPAAARAAIPFVGIIPACNVSGIERDPMAIKLEQDTERSLIESVKRFFAEELDDDIGDLKALLVLDFCVREIGPSIYNQAIADAQSFFQEKSLDLGAARYEPEFGFWQKKRGT